MMIFSLKTAFPVPSSLVRVGIATIADIPVQSLSDNPPTLYRFIITLMKHQCIVKVINKK